MHDLTAIFARLRDCADERVALVTLLTREGSSYRRPGARMLVTKDDAFGVLSGGCVEASLTAAGRAVIASGTPRVVGVDTSTAGDELWGFGVGCPAVLEFLVEPLQAHALPAALTTVRECLASGARCVLVTEVAAPARQWAIAQQPSVDVPESLTDPIGDAQRHGKSSIVNIDGARFFVEAIERPIHLLVVGGGDNAQPLVRIAHEIGWNVTVTDRRPALVTRERFPQAYAWIAVHPEQLGDAVLERATAAVLLTHHHATDVALLPRLLATSISYIGLLGSQRRCAQLLDELRVPVDQRARVHGPVGLDIGAEGPHEIALAIVAEIRAVLSHREGGPLSRRAGTDA